MTVKFFRMIIEGTDESVLNTIKVWFESKIDQADLHQIIGGGEVNVSQDLDGVNWTLGCDMYIMPNKSLLKYKTFLVDKFKTFDKSTLLSAKIIKFDNCTHDEDTPEPCEPTTILEWVNEGDT